MKPNRCGKPFPQDYACGLDAGHEGECGALPSLIPPAMPWKRANYVPAPHFYNLNQACVLLNQAFGGFGCYLVGSALERRDFRDVDVRLILEDAEYARLFRSPEGGWLDPFWSLLCTTISAWLSQQSGLPIDFQIQQQTKANAEHSGKRSALGIFLDYPGERPSETSAAVVESPQCGAGPGS